jgi:sodium transport system permease protein
MGTFPVDMENLSDPSSDIERLRSGEVDAILRLKQTGDDTWNYSVIQLSTSEHSREARSRILTELYYWEQAVINRTLTDAGLDPEETLDPVRWEGDESAANAATSGEKAGLALSMFIPMVLAIWTATSAIQPAIDMTAGERERGTLEALLCLPCTRIELLAGKWLAVATITSVGVGLQISGLIFAITYLASSTSLGVPTISLGAALLLLFAVVIFAVMVVAFELAIAMKAHSVKEAGTLLGPAVLIIMFPALFTQIINLDGVESWWYAVPLVNILLAMRELLLDRIIVDHVAIWAISSALYAAFAAWYAARQFKREDLVASLS